MDFDSNDFILVLVGLVIAILVRTLFRAGKEINSSDKFPTSKNRQDSKKMMRIPYKINGSLVWIGDVAPLDFL